MLGGAFPMTVGRQLPWQDFDEGNVSLFTDILLLTLLDISIA